MKNREWRTARFPVAVASAAGLSLLLLGGCTDDSGEEAAEAGETLLPGEEQVSLEEVGRKSLEALETAKEWSFQKKEEFRRAVEARLEKLSRETKALRDKAAAAGAEVRKKLEDELATLEEKRRAIERKLEKVGSTTKEGWSDFTSELGSAVEELQEAYRKAASEVQSTSSSS